MNNVSVLLITHNRIGRALVETAQTMLHELPFRLALLPISQTCDPDKEVQVAQDLCRQLDNGQGVLILTDAFGSTPSNIAGRTAKAIPKTAVVAGVNLPMVLKIANYPNLTLQELAENAVAGGQRGVLQCSQAVAE
jgi:PTS system ascorbate-specific IIA component